MEFVKRTPAELPQASLIESAGLRWLAAAESAGGPRIAQVISAEPGTLRLERISTSAATASAAERLGTALARMHGSLSHESAFGSLPPDHPKDQPALFGPADQPLRLGTADHGTWGALMAEERLDPVLRMLTETISPSDADLLRAAQERIGSGELDDGESAALVHGDLWSGNVLFTGDGGEDSDPRSTAAVLIDPAAYAGHRVDDLAMLHLFGAPHVEVLVEAYLDEHQLRDQWRDRIPLHQFFPLTVHWALFGPAYRSPTMAAAESVLRL